MNDHARYISPFSSRYASEQMQYVFSDDNKFRTWRRLWIALARAQKRQGLPVTEEQIAQMEAFCDDINYDDALERERQCRHDVMSHVYAYGLQCPDARGIIHLGATSCYVGDNADILIMRQGLELVHEKLLDIMAVLADFAHQHRALPCLAYTHLQPAQLTTVGKRAALWLHDLYLDQQELSHRMAALALPGSKGATGTQASFAALLDGDIRRIRRLEADIAREMGLERIVPVSGQTYSRKMDYMVLSTLSGIAQTASKFSHDIRLLQSFGEMEEPFEDEQIGSSAMPYKRNPMRSERITALSRYVMVDVLNAAVTAATQWFERTLDDSANRRIAISEAFLGTDAVLNLMLSVCRGLKVYPQVIRARVMNELPFMATENVLMHAVRSGGDRQQLHERLRRHSMAVRQARRHGRDGDLVQLIANDPVFGLTEEEILRMLDPVHFIGLSREQTETFLEETIRPLLAQNGPRGAKQSFPQV